jgi:hypothetical protein
MIWVRVSWFKMESSGRYKLQVSWSNDFGNETVWFFFPFSA